MSQKRFLVFVYGTLKKGEPNHHWLSSPENGVQQFKGQAITVNQFPLVIASRYNIPYLMDKAGVGNKIMGEIYEVDEKMLEKLDELEDHPRYYERRIEKVTKVDTKEEMSCWIYLLKKYKEEMLSLPMLSNYKSEDDHGRPYVPSDDISDPEDIDV
eukprot:GFUD01068200.1.p1 GENE.GFUD01068200.1~~GFUD01068200.1.p1  ORF type:complete len:156 (+),score=57.77 GFUD01068200.1:70-537(+)